MTQQQVAILGGGIVGLATAFELTTKHPHVRVVVFEKEADVGAHQTGHNSGVLHSGIYYKPGSLKALNCRTGKRAMEEFCAQYGVSFDICGKVIVAVDESELPQLERIYERGQQNGVRCELIGQERLKELEPHAAGVRAIYVPEAGIVNFRAACRKMAELVVQRGGEVRTSARVLGIRERERQVTIRTTAGDFTTDYAISCCGLYSDRVARAAGLTVKTQIVPFRGEYYELRPDAQHLCRNLIYPVPDPSFPFLGVHFTRMIEGGIECGPNAVLALAREGYGKFDVNFRDLTETLLFRGFQRMARKYWRIGAGEIWRSWSKAAFVHALSRLVPEIRSQHLAPHRAGVRAQSISPDGAMVDDFVIHPAGRVIHVLNAPSPAATSSLNIGKLVVQRLDEQLASQ